MKKKINAVLFHYIHGTLSERTRPFSLAFVFCTALSFQTATAWAQLPVTGVYVPELVMFDDLMQNYMADNNIESGILAISKDGRIVYQRGFGYAQNTIDPLPENTPMRLASVEKPITAAVIRDLVADNIISLDDFVFHVDLDDPVPGPGGEQRLLEAHSPSSPYYPYDGLGDARIADIRVQHLLSHQGGWDVDAAAFWPQFSAAAIAAALEESSPPGRVNTVKYMLSQPLQFDPGVLPPECNEDVDGNCIVGDPDPCHCNNYSNFSYMLLGLIVEQVTAETHINAVRQRVLTPQMWIPATEIFMGRTFSADQSPREPLYLSVYTGTSVFHPYGQVSSPYGTWDHESFLGHGNFVASAAPILSLANHYRVQMFSSSIGAPLDVVLVNGDHNGSLPGTNTVVKQYDDGFCIVVLFNERDESANPTGFARRVAADARNLILAETGIDWASLQSIDGSWVDFNQASSGFGGHDDPYHNMDTAMAEIADGTKLRFKAGTSNWSGTITKRTLINAPFGTAIIGQ